MVVVVVFVFSVTCFLVCFVYSSISTTGRSDFYSVIFCLLYV